MKKEIHPKKNLVRFIDTTTGYSIDCYTAMKSNDVIQENGVEIHQVKVALTSHSHPYFSGQHGPIDVEGKIDKFRNRYKKRTTSTTK